MRLPVRPAGLVLIGLLTCFWLTPGHPQARVRAGSKLPGKLTQQPSTPEPPLAGQTPPAPPPAPDWPRQLPTVVTPAPAVVPAVPVAVVPAPPVVIVDPGPIDPPTPTVTLRLRVQACAPAGQQLEYRLCVENTSAAEAHHVLVRNPLPPNARFVRAIPEPNLKEPELQWQLGTLPPCCCKEIVLVLEPIGTDEVRNCARVQFEHGQCVVTRIARLAPVVPVAPGALPPGTTPPVMPRVQDSGDRITPLPGAAEAKLDLKVSGPDRQPINQPATYTFTVSNTGGSPATRLLVACVLPEKLKFVSASDGGKFLEGQVAWVLESLSGGASRSYQLTVQGEPGRHCLRPYALADRDLLVRTEFCTVFFGGSGLGATMETTRDPVAVGEQTSYVIIVYNQGNVPATNIRIRVQLPVQMEVVRGVGPGVNNQLEDPKKTVGAAVVFDPFTNLQPGGSLRYEVVAWARQAGVVVVRSELTADQLKAGGPVIQERSTTIITDQEMSRRRARATSYRPSELKGDQASGKR